MTEEVAERRDECLCGAVVSPSWVGEPDANSVRLERGSCTTCGLQLVRSTGEAWRHIRG